MNLNHQYDREERGGATHPKLVHSQRTSVTIVTANVSRKHGLQACVKTLPGQTRAMQAQCAGNRTWFCERTRPVLSGGVCAVEMTIHVMKLSTQFSSERKAARLVTLPSANLGVAPPSIGFRHTIEPPSWRCAPGVGEGEPTIVARQGGSNGLPDR